MEERDVFKHRAGGMKNKLVGPPALRQRVGVSSVNISADPDNDVNSDSSGRTVRQWWFTRSWVSQKAGERKLPVGLRHSIRRREKVFDGTKEN